ncbi:AAA family ATPase [Intrasporangium sp.]|uniref:AAA family ATPase n=1 Tax=Intrasporangium sp. TaxID=1925024 RepID=UPI00293B4A4B|nr:AAA family ATPase [Intrasporangium sp.]MDV3221487.1 AAA family ATPase [Intrasporangium sp.]
MHLICVIGPPAVGKMTVGRVVCELTGYRLFHNHMSIEPLLGIFDFGTPSFHRLNSLIRREVIREAVAADLSGLVFSFAWDFDSAADTAEVERIIAPVVDAGMPVDFVELHADQEVRLAREGGADRVEHKRSKRDVDWARSHVVEIESRARFSSMVDEAGQVLGWPLPAHRLLRLDNGHGSPRVTAEHIVGLLELPRAGS